MALEAIGNPICKQCKGLNTYQHHYDSRSILGRWDHMLVIIEAPIVRCLHSLQKREPSSP